MRRNFLRKINNFSIKHFSTRYEPIKILDNTSFDLTLSKHFSSLGEEKILYDTINEIKPIEHYYVDIGAGDGVTMSNTACLAIQGWSGVCFEYDKVKAGKMAMAYENFHDVGMCQSKISPLNVNGFLKSFQVPENFGVLSLDIDSYDYFVLQKILADFKPTIIIAEINEKIPPPLEFTVLFDKNHYWDESHLFGQSLSQIDKLCKEHGYAIAVLEYNNVFLVDKKRYAKPGLTPGEAYYNGYFSKPDRKQKFPWNHDIEEVLTMNPGEAEMFLKQYFVKYEGKYSLTVGPA